MRQKLITLCPNSWDIAQKKGNFSSWVRTRLIQDTNEVDCLEEEITYLRDQNNRMSALLDAIREGKKHWVDGRGWDIVNE